ncbi:pyridoxal-dependent decarboxylase [Shigella flexneri]
MNSISASGHKFGLAPLGCGWVIWRDEQRCRRNWCSTLTTWVVKLVLLPSLLPPGGSGHYKYYEFLRLGREGYTKSTERLLPGCRLSGG